MPVINLYVICSFAMFSVFVFMVVNVSDFFYIVKCACNLYYYVALFVDILLNVVYFCLYRLCLMSALSWIIFFYRYC